MPVVKIKNPLTGEFEQYPKKLPVVQAATPDIQVGTTETLPAGSPATVTRRADSPDTAPVFDFGIPSGLDGTGDMVSATYDTTGKNQDIFAYTDAAEKRAKAASRPVDWMPTAQEVGADPAGSAGAVDGKLSGHDANATKHITAGERTAWNGKAARSVKVSANISTTWEGSDVPYTQTISVAGVTADSVVEITLPSIATAEQVAQYQALNLQDGGQVAGSITLRAFGKKNTADIPVTAIVRGDL